MALRNPRTGPVRPGLAPRLRELASSFGREHLDTDPISFVHEARTPGGGEIAGLVASSLAVGNVAQIRRSVAAVLARVDPDHLAANPFPAGESAW